MHCYLLCLFNAGVGSKVDMVYDRIWSGGNVFEMGCVFPKG